MIRIALVLGLAAGCASKLPAAAECSQTSDCDTGLECLELGQFSGTTCTPAAKVCTKTCQGDTDCASLGSTFKCFATCTAGMMVCGNT